MKKNYHDCSKGCRQDTGEVEYHFSIHSILLYLIIVLSIIALNLRMYKNVYILDHFSLVGTVDFR